MAVTIGWKDNCLELGSHAICLDEGETIKAAVRYREDLFIETVSGERYVLRKAFGFGGTLTLERAYLKKVIRRDGRYCEALPYSRETYEKWYASIGVAVPTWVTEYLDDRETAPIEPAEVGIGLQGGTTEQATGDPAPRKKRGTPRKPRKPRKRGGE